MYVETVRKMDVIARMKYNCELVKNNLSAEMEYRVYFPGSDKIIVASAILMGGMWIFNLRQNSTGWNLPAEASEEEILKKLGELIDTLWLPSTPVTR